MWYPELPVRIQLSLIHICPYNKDGSLASQNDGTWTGIGQNPIEWMSNNPVNHKKYKLLSTVFAELTPVKDLTVRAQFGADYAHLSLIHIYLYHGLYL